MRKISLKLFYIIKSTFRYSIQEIRNGSVSGYNVVFKSNSPTIPAIVREVDCILHNRANCKMCQTFRMYKLNTLCQPVAIYTIIQRLISTVKLCLQPCMYMCVCAYHTYIQNIFTLAKQQSIY